MICVNCGKDIGEIKGSMKHPYCEKCWDNTQAGMFWYDKYKSKGVGKNGINNFVL